MGKQVVGQESAVQLNNPAPEMYRPAGARKIALWKITVASIALSLVFLSVLYLPYRTQSSVSVHGEQRSDCCVSVSQLAEPPAFLRGAGLSFDAGTLWQRIGCILFATTVAVWGPLWKTPGQEPSPLNVVGVFLLAVIVFFTAFFAVAARHHPTYVIVCPSNDIAL